jgi:cob(I)alamin adenosyltransferase
LAPGFTAHRCRRAHGGFHTPALEPSNLTMSIVTRTGDAGMTGLMYNRRVPKSDPRVEAYGTVDELNAALGLARATSTPGPIRDHLSRIQKDLVALMGELATHPEDLDRYAHDGYPRITQSSVDQLDQWVVEIENHHAAPRGWAMPGQTLHAATLDLARTVCRRAERFICALRETGPSNYTQILVYLNRLSDLLWLYARALEQAATE